MMQGEAKAHSPFDWLGAIARPLSWLCVIILALLSWVPADDMVRTGMLGGYEHVLAYAGSMIVLCLGYAGRFGLGRLVVGLTAYGAVLEWGQRFSPGRHSSLLDFAASTFGLLAGAAAFSLFRRLCIQSTGRLDE